MTTERKEKAVSIVLFSVDEQNGFCPGGELPVPGGDEVIPQTNRLKREIDARRQRGSNDESMASLDMHPLVTTHFKQYGGDWPEHCVLGTKSAAFHPDLDVEGVVIVLKGLNPEEDAYSAFDGFVLATAQSLKDYLLKHNVTEIIFCGLATDYCVLNTVVDAIEKLPGVKVIVVTDAIRAVNIQPGDGERAIAQMRAKGAVFMTTDEVVERLASRD